MNGRMIVYTVGMLLKVEAALMLLPLAVCLIYGESPLAFGAVILVLLALGQTMSARRPKNDAIYAREGFFIVGLSWILLSVFGALPFVISGEIPRFVDALFETVSGFTTTGASILTDVEAMSYGMLFWRSFTHWVGGMGVLVFLLAIVPSTDRGKGFTMHLLRAESPGPSVGKLVPKMRQTAAILYILYIGLTIADVIFLVLGKMDVFEAVCNAFGTAGTGGFGVRNDSFASYSPYLQNVTAIFMFLFGVNFTCYYFLLIRQFGAVFRDEELRAYFGIVLGSTLLIAWNIRGQYVTLEETFRHAAFQVSSITTTTGFATTDFDQWPSFSKTILLCLMVIGASAGSTGGGMKVSRLILLFKSLRRSFLQMLHPRRVQMIRNNGQVVDDKIVETTNAYLIAYVFILFVSFLLLSPDGFSTGTNFSAVLCCFNNIGPGLEAVGPTCNFSGFSILSKLVLIFDMLLGRLEIFPILCLFSRHTWHRTVR